MTSVELRRSGRKSAGHRKHSDGGYSDTSSVGSYLDETDREVSSLTDRAFRSLCIGDEAVYNDSDLCSSSPCSQRDRQLAFCQRGREDRDTGDNDGEDLDRTVHESFRLKVQQYGQDQIHGRLYEADVQRDPRWEINGERGQGRVSATFRRSFVETSQQEEYLGEEQSSFHSNGATESSTRQRRSRSRVSSLIRAFNSEGHRDGAGTDGKLREWNDETSWDKSALMSMRRELSEFSTSYQQNSGNFPSAGPFSSHHNNFHSAAHVNSASFFISSSHSRQSMSEQHGQSNFFIHSEFSPFKLWRDHSRFPFQQAAPSGFMHCSEIPKWYETPMYRELSLDAQPQGPHRFDERGIRQPRNTMAPAAPPTLPRPTSTSTLLQKASAVEKRCESELTGHYPHKTWMQSPGTKRFPSQRPSTASPTSEMSRRVQDTISSVKALQQKIKMMTEQNTAAATTANEQGGLCSNTHLNPFGNNAANAVGGNTSTTPFSISHLLSPSVHAHYEAEATEVRRPAVSPQPVEHPPVRAESRGATPDVRGSSYKSRATGLLFNLKDNRKRVKSTYSPATFKGSETLEKNKHYSTQEARDTVIDIPDFPDPDPQLFRGEESSVANADSRQHVNQNNTPGLFTRQNSQTAHTGIRPEYTSRDYHRGRIQNDMVNPSEFTGFLPENNSTSRQPANGQILHEDLWSFHPRKQDNTHNVETLGGDLYRFETSYTATEIPRLNADDNQPREYLISKANAEQNVNETVGREFTKVDGYEQLKENKHDYSNVSSEDRWRQTNSQDTENLHLSPWKQEITALTDKEAHQRADVMKEKANSLNKKYRGENQIGNSFAYGTNSQKKAELVNTNISNQQPQNAPFSYDTVERSAYNGQQQQGTLKDKNPLQKYNGHIHENEFKDNNLTQKYNRHTDQQRRNQHTLYSNEDKSMLSQETHHRKRCTPIPKGRETQSQPPAEQRPTQANQANQAKARQFVEVGTEAHHAHAELDTAGYGAQVEQPTAESARLTGLEKVKADQATAELTEHFEEQEQSREKQPHWTRKEQTETEQIQKQKETEEPTNITEEVAAQHSREEHGGQVKAIQAEAERLKKEHIKTEPAKTEQADRTRLEEEVKLEQKQRQQVETGQKTKVVEVEKVKANNNFVEAVKQESGEEETAEASQGNADQLTTHINKAKGRKADQTKLEKTKAELVEAEATKDMQEKCSKTAAKHTVTQPIKSEPGNVRTELAEMKAGEQKEKTDLPLKLCINKNEEDKGQAQASQTHQQREDIVVRGQYVDQANKGSDEYERLREKYGFIDTDSVSKNKASATGNVSSKDATPAASLDRVETTDNEKSKESSSPRSKAETANTEEKEEVGVFKPTELTESRYVCSESSKELKLSGGNHLPINVDQMNDNSVENKLLKQTDVSQHRDSDSAQLLPLQKNLKSTEHCARPGKDLHFTPPRASKERALTKQEILTSKIKAHAEKEISAIKEKGFAVRDGFIFKNSTKQLSGGLSYNIRQMPPSQEVPRKHESTIHINTTTKHLMEPSGLQEPMKSNYNAPKPLREEEKMGSHTMSANEDLGEKHKKYNTCEIKSTIQSKDLSPENKQCNLEANQGESSGEPIKIPATNTDDLDKKKEGPSQATAAVRADDSESISTEKDESKAEAVQEDSAPSINLVFGQKEIPAADDSLQIMGIMVTVRERKPATDNSPRTSSTQEQMIVKGMDRFHPASGLEVGEGNTSSEEVSTVQNTPPTVKQDQTKADINAHLENVQENPTSETRQNNVSEKITGKRLNHQLESSSINAEPQLQERLDEQPVPSSVTIATKNEVAEIQPLPYNHDIMKSQSLSLIDNENKQVFPKHQDKETHMGGTDQMDDNVHVGSIAVRVAPAVTVKDNPKPHVTPVPSDLVPANEQNQVGSSVLVQKVISFNNEDRSKDLISESGEEQIEKCLEDTSGVQCVLSSAKERSDSLKMKNSEITETEIAKPDKLNKSGTSVDESMIELMVGDYFHVQRVAETSNEPHSSAYVGDSSEGKELPRLPPNKAAISTESCSEGKNEDSMWDQSKRKKVESSSGRKNRKTEGNPASKPSYGPSERWSNKKEKTDAGQASHIVKHHADNRSTLSARERQSTRSSDATKDQKVKEKPEVKPLPKERVPTIPEISAIADYARLKVIVSEDEENVIQEFPPNKKEGFFPLIQTRQSRRPVFTADPQDLSVKDKHLHNKTEASPKVNKEAKPLVFPITEKEHRRTGMFKLADKETQEKKPLDAKDTAAKHAKHAQHLKGRNKSPTTPHENQRSEARESGRDTVCPVAQNIHRPNNPPVEAVTSTSAVNQQRSTSIKPLDASTPHEDPEGPGFNTQGEQQRVAEQFEERNTSRPEEEKRAEDMRVKRLLEENRASLAQEERRAAQREEEKRAREREAIATKIKQRREKQREAERRAREKQAALKEEEMRTKQREEERQMREIEEKRLIMIEKERRQKLREEEERRKEDEERRWKQREDAIAAQEEQQRRADQEEQERRADQEEQERRADQEEQQRRADQEEQQRRADQEEQQRRADQEEQQRRADQEEQQRRADQEEQQQRRADQEEQQRREAEEEQKRRADQEEQQRREAEEEQKRRADQEKQQQRRADQEEQQRREAEEEQKRRADQEEQQRRTEKEEQERRADQEEKQRRADREEQQRRSDLIEAQRQAKHIEELILAEIEDKNKIKQREERERIREQEQEIEEQRHTNEELMRSQREEDQRIRNMIKQRQVLQIEEERNRRLEEDQEALKEEKRVAQEWMQAQREEESRAKIRGGEEEKLANHREKERDTRMEEQKAQRMDALQYYAITSKPTDRKPIERERRSPPPSPQRHNMSRLASSENSGSHARSYRPHAAASPAPSLPRSNTSSPSPGAKPLMFRVKDNTIRGSSLTKSVKPRFHKNFGDDFRVGSPMERASGREEDEQDSLRRSAGTPVYPDAGLNRLDADRESSALQPAHSSQDYSAPLQQRKPYSRRSIVLDEDDSRSVISNVSEGGESFATSAADLADIRGLYDYERPESACSFGSAASRSLGRPPTVPPKSEKALRRAQRLTTRRIRKELSKIDGHAGVEKSLQEVSSVPSSSGEERSAGRQVVASPHFASPISLAHAPTSVSSFPSALTERPSSHSSFYATPHVTGPISLPVASLPGASSKATGTASHSAPPETMAHVPPSPALYPANHQAPVAQYHVESSYPHSYPLTQRKVLQDLGSGQYFVVDVPVTVKTKTFFDPETGKYVQLNVRQSGQNYVRPQPQQTHPQQQLQPQMHVKLQHQAPDPSASKPAVLHQGHRDHPRDHQPPTGTSVPCHSSSAPSAFRQEQRPSVESHAHGQPAHQMGQKCEGHRYSPEKTPYMDTANDKEKTFYNLHGPNEWCPEDDANSQHAGGSVGEDDNSAPSQCEPRDIITISELEDFMEMSDW
ncbi:rootletin [Pungitius pungitius]|uniref:rootletin n=1 Tax=Pungitius pungitius TaxID=134920 RepID=UPI002E1625AD